ncbi:hypothetical protein P7K49_011937 [Saguinus oedipus]|uniref:Dynein heavy chain linker domain-containing protein n=1 Tax=Saguinus oedipus TaxID=9490 RepID=A0ABQ9VS28_SAGOE|nr:hypothetical protein P7K49_011937 [Saguinus oedipus]
MEGIMEALSKSGSLFEVTVPDYKQLKACHREVRLLKELWDMIVMVSAGHATQVGPGVPHGAVEHFIRVDSGVPHGAAERFIHVDSGVLHGAAECFIRVDSGVPHGAAERFIRVDSGALHGAAERFICVDSGTFGKPRLSHCKCLCQQSLVPSMTVSFQFHSHSQLTANVNTSIEDWKTTKWKDINVEQMDIDCKKFAKDVRSLDKEMKTWDAFVGLDNTVKNMITSLCAVSELQNPAIRERHWQQLMQATQVPCGMVGGGDCPWRQLTQATQVPRGMVALGVGTAKRSRKADRARHETKAGTMVRTYPKDQGSMAQSLRSRRA